MIVLFPLLMTECVEEEHHLQILPFLPGEGLKATTTILFIIIFFLARWKLLSLQIHMLQNRFVCVSIPVHKLCVYRLLWS